MASFLFPPTNQTEGLIVNEIKQFCVQQMVINGVPQCLQSARSLPSSAVTEKHEENMFFFSLINMQSVSAESEIDRYITERIEINDNFNPLVWWSDNATKYKRLRKLALSVLSIAASSAASERVFSQAANIITEKRNRLAPKTVDSLIFLHSIFPSHFDRLCLCASFKFLIFCSENFFFFLNFNFQLFRFHFYCLARRAY